MERYTHVIYLVAVLLVLIGALNWGLVGALNWGLVGTGTSVVAGGGAGCGVGIF